MEQEPIHTDIRVIAVGSGRLGVAAGAARMGASTGGHELVFPALQASRIRGMFFPWRKTRGDYAPEREISGVGGSLRDVRQLAGHASLRMTRRRIEVSGDAMRKVVG